MSLLLTPWASLIVSLVFTAAVDTFLWCANGFSTVFCSLWLVTFHISWWLAVVVLRMAEGLTVEALSHWTGVLKFFPFDNTMAEFVDLKDFAYVRTWSEGDYNYWIFGYYSVSCFICFG